MCGISGYLDMEHGVSTELLERMTNVIRYRGPDDEGYALIGSTGVSFFSGKDTMQELALPSLQSVKETTAFLGFGHRRLSILDLTAGGHQPMALLERDLVVTYNGELYNYLELRAELEALGHCFQTTSDTEVLLYAYCQWGEDCLTHFNGMWSFAIWDGQENKLFCARDRLGAKPFHYMYRGNRFLFGSELKQLCVDKTETRHFDHSYLAANLLYRISDFNDRTLIKDLRVLPAGNKLILCLNPERTSISQLKITPYWSLSVCYRYDIKEAEWEERVAEEFARACRWRLRSDAPVAALLSGGLDSSCLVTELCGQMQDPTKLQTFTTSYPGDASCDEWEFADMINKACGCIGNQVIPRPSAIEQQFENLIWHLEGIGGLAPLGGKMLMDEISKRGYKVILNGQCGDELMLGYERYYSFYFSNLLRLGKVKTFLREFHLASKHSRLSLSALAQFYAYFNFAQVRDTRQFHRTGRFVTAELLQSRNKAELHDLLYPKTLEQLQYTELTATQLTNIVRLDDRVYMSASIESRIPFMDYRFVELACTIPPEYKIKNGYTKHLMRKIFDCRMPKAVTWRTNKMGFGAPVNDWAAMFSKDYLLDQVNTAKTAPYFHTDALKKTIQNNQKDASIYEFLTIEQFARQFGVI